MTRRGMRRNMAQAGYVDDKKGADEEKHFTGITMVLHIRRKYM